MKLFIIFKGFCYNDITKMYKDLDDAKSHYSPNIKIVEAPDYVFESWHCEEKENGELEFIKPEIPEGFLYDEDTGTFYKILSNKEKRKNFYIFGTCYKENERFFIEYDGEELSVEAASRLGSYFEFRGDAEKSDILKELVNNKIKEIREKYPD